MRKTLQIHYGNFYMKKRANQNKQHMSYLHFETPTNTESLHTSIPLPMRHMTESSSQAISIRMFTNEMNINFDFFHPTTKGDITSQNLGFVPFFFHLHNLNAGRSIQPKSKPISVITS